MRTENRHTIFIPLKTDWYEGNDPCVTEGGQNNPDTTVAPVKGVKINVEAGDGFAVLDGDATDGPALLQIDNVENATYNVYVYAKGKPGGCLDLEAYNYDAGGVLHFIGSIDVDRGRAKPGRLDIRHLLYDNGTSYFDDAYENYFWQLYNNGLRLMNVRFYEVPAS
ncbi:hypothetical protein ACFLV5_06235 [Chloroflexota bacterium]